MLFFELSSYFQKLESTASRITMTEILAELYKKVDANEAMLISYLLQGRVAPIFSPTEFGLADRLMIRAIAQAVEAQDKEVTQVFKIKGDLGSTAEDLKKGKGESFDCAQDKRGKGKVLTIKEVFDVLHTIAIAGGTGSQEKKIDLLADLIKKSDPLSSRYIVRIPLGKLRLGFSDMTILDSLSWMLEGDKSKRPAIEKAFNVRPDLGFIAQTVKGKGIAGLARITPTPATPILMARANRLSSAGEILEKIGKCAIEFKYDGLRLQVHKHGKIVTMFSRNLENITPMFPDIEEAVGKQIIAQDVIFEGEVVAFNPKTGVHVPFQETMQRKRKYDIEKKATEIPVKLYVFELLYLNGTNFISEPYLKRKEKLKTLISSGKTIIYAQEKITNETVQIEEMFHEAIKENFEGIIAKKLEGVYEAGMRSWNWIKFKKAMDTKLADTIDAVVMGFTKGEGKRTSFGIGQFLAGVYDNKKDEFVTVTKVGTGLTDEQFREFIRRAKKLVTKEKPKNYSLDNLMEPDVWMKPQLVVELGSDEITRSPVHTAGRVMQPSKSGTAEDVKIPGFALRFPRLVRFRDDKGAMDVTTVSEIKDLFTKQGSKK